MAGSHIFSPKFNCWSDLSSSPRDNKHAHATDLIRSPISLLSIPPYKRPSTGLSCISSSSPPLPCFLFGSGGQAGGERRWFVLKRRRCDTNEGCDIEVTVTSSEELHAQAEKAKKQKREEKAASSGGAEKDPGPEDGA